MLDLRGKLGLSVAVFCFASSVMAAASLPKGPCALLYDADYSEGPSSKPTNLPGRWSDNITAFNTGAVPSGVINCLYPYSGDIEMYCTGPSDCIYSGPKQNVFVYYTTASGGSGQASVEAYRTVFPKANILAIIDGNTKSTVLKAFTYAEVGKNTADLVARTICADPKVNGIFFDIEKFDISVPGQFAFYQEISKQFASPMCTDASNPNGRTFGVFLSPGKISDWDAVAAAFGHNGYGVVSGYDVADKTPPVPASINAYHASVTGMLQTMDAASTKFKIPYQVAIPAASSFSEFEKLGVYDKDNPPSYFKLLKNFTPEGITQIGYIKSARAIILATCKSAYFMGKTYWSWSQYKSKNPSAEQMLEPSIPEGAVVPYLQQFGG